MAARPRPAGPLLAAAGATRLASAQPPAWLASPPPKLVVGVTQVAPFAMRSADGHW